MSDKLTQDFDLYYKELENFTGHFKTSSQVIATDPHLSKAGKSASLAELQKEHEKDLSSLGERLQKDFGKRVSNINDFVNGKTTDKRIEGIQGRLKKGESLTSDQQNRLIIHELAENKQLMAKSSFQNMLANADIEQIKKTAQTLSNSQDVERLEWLKELADLRGEGALGGSLGGQIAGIRTANLNDEQKNLQLVSARIQKGLELFQYSLERSKKGDFMDVRQSEEIIDNE